MILILLLVAALVTVIFRMCEDWMDAADANTKPVGTLNVITQDDASEPYLFLEIDKGMMRELYEKKTVALRVDRSLSRK